MAFDLSPVVIGVVVALAVALLVLIILTATYLKSRRRLMESRREARVRRQRRVKFSERVDKTTTSGVMQAADNGNGGGGVTDDQPDDEDENHRPLYRPIHAIGLHDGNRTQRQIYLPPVSRRGLWSRNLDLDLPPQLPQPAAFSWPRPLPPANNIYPPPQVSLPPLPQPTPPQQLQQPNQGFRDPGYVEVSRAPPIRRRMVFDEENDAPFWGDIQNNNQPPFASNLMPPFQTRPAIVLDNPPRQVPDLRLENQTPDVQTPAAIRPVFSAPIPAVRQPPAGPVLPPPGSAPAPAAAESDRAAGPGTEVAEVSWSVVDNGENANGWSSNTSGYVPDSRAPSTSAAFFARPVPAVRRSLLTSSTSGIVGRAGDGRRQFEDEEQSVSMSSTGTVHFR